MPETAENQKTKIPGAALIKQLWEEMELREETANELAVQLGITYSYLMALSRGERPINQVSRPVLLAAAKYLKLPAAQIYMLAGALQPEDFVYDGEREEKLERVRQAMERDPVWTGYALDRKSFEALDMRARMLICLLYERAAKTAFFEDDTPLPPDL